jgi:hypothetical protein
MHPKPVVKRITFSYQIVLSEFGKKYTARPLRGTAKWLIA